MATPRSVTQVIYPCVMGGVAGVWTLVRGRARVLPRAGVSYFTGHVPRSPYRVTYNLDSKGDLMVCRKSGKVIRYWQHLDFAHWVPEEEAASPPGYRCCFLPGPWRGKRVRRTVREVRRA